MAGQYYLDKIDVCKDAVSISGISMTYVLSKSLEKNKGLELYSPGGICHLCRAIREELQRCGCDGALKRGFYCDECQLGLQALLYLLKLYLIEFFSSNLLIYHKPYHVENKLYRVHFYK